ncbi:serine/threonine protein kinase [Candidatus Uabimicrobium sp. HlEnr_7]|uniref:serine/threonine protein kinase n=1 Tax=Candidatus Uabimicrobium helgolandensis TaxID=3095367 RepID=UPI003556E1CE
MNNKYQIIKELGRGGMGVVYHVHDRQLNRECALKVLHNTTDVSRKRFIEEARAIAKLHHSNIIQVYEISYFEQNGTTYPYFTMAYVKGISFDIWLQQQDSMEQKLSIFCQICEGVGYAHANNIIHRDLKPHNIIVTENNVAIVLDFGLAKNIDKDTHLTQTGEIFGTPKYIAPEIVTSGQADHLSDLYSLGVILYEMLTGFVPFDGKNPIEIIFKLATTTPMLPSKLNRKIVRDSDIELVCMKAIEKIPQKRFHSVSLLQQEISAIREGKPISIRPVRGVKKLLLQFKQNSLAQFFAFISIASIIWALVLWKITDQKIEAVNLIVNEAHLKIAEGHEKQLNNIARQLEYHMDFAINNKSVFLPLLDKWIEAYKEVDKVISESKKITNEWFRRFEKTHTFLKFFILPRLSKRKQTKLFVVQQLGKTKLSHSGRYVASYNENALEIYDQNRKLYQEDGIFMGFSRDDKYVVYQKKGLHFFSLKQGKEIPSFPCFKHPRIIFAKNMIAYTSKKNEITVLSAQNLLEKAKFQTEKPVKRLLFSPDEKWLLMIAPSHMCIGNVTNSKIQVFQNFLSDWNIGATFWYSGDKLKLYLRDYLSKNIFFELKNNKWSIEKQYQNYSQKEFYPSLDLVKINSENIILAKRKKVFLKNLESQAEYELCEHASEVQEVFFLNNDLVLSESLQQIEISSIRTKKTILSLKNQGQIHNYSNTTLELFSTKKHSSNELNCILKKVNIYPSLVKILQPKDPHISTKQINDFRKLSTGTMHDNSLRAFATPNLNCIFVPTSIAMFMWEKYGDTYKSKIEPFAPLFMMKYSAFSKDKRWVLLYLVNTISKSTCKFHLYQTSKDIYQNKKEIYIDAEKDNYIQAFDFSNDNRFIYIGGMQKIWKCPLEYLLNNRKILLTSLSLFCSVNARIVSIKIKQNLMAVGQGGGSLSIFANNKLDYQVKHLHTKNINRFCWANTKQTLAFVSNNEVHLLTKQNNEWQERKLQYLTQSPITDIGFDPQDRYLAIFTEDSFVVYDLRYDFFVSSVVGYYKSMGASFTSGWKHMVCASLEEVAIFDLSKQDFNYYPEFFEDDIHLENFIKKLKFYKE